MHICISSKEWLMIRKPNFDITVLSNGYMCCAELCVTSSGQLSLYSHCVSQRIAEFVLKKYKEFVIADKVDGIEIKYRPQYDRESEESIREREMNALIGNMFGPLAHRSYILPQRHSPSHGQGDFQLEIHLSRHTSEHRRCLEPNVIIKTADAKKAFVLFKKIHNLP